MDRGSSGGLRSPARRRGERANEPPAVGCLPLSIAELWPRFGFSHAGSSPAAIINVLLRHHLGLMKSKGAIPFPEDRQPGLCLGFRAETRAGQPWDVLLASVGAGMLASVGSDLPHLNSKLRTAVLARVLGQAGLACQKGLLCAAVPIFL